MDADTTQINADNYTPCREDTHPRAHPAPAARYLNGIVSRFSSATEHDPQLSVSICIYLW